MYSLTESNDVRASRYGYYFNGSALSVQEQWTTVQTTKSGTRVEGWRQKIAQGKSASSSYSLDTETVEEARATWSYTQHKQNLDEYSEDNRVHPGTGHITSIPSLPAWIDTEAKRRVFKELQQAREAIQGMVAVAEMAKTRDTVASLLNGLISTAFNAKRQLLNLRQRLIRQGVSFRTGSRTISNKWLELQMGILPTISDISALMDEVSGKYLPTVKVRGTARDSYNSSDPIYGSVKPGASGLDYRHRITFTYEHQVRYVYGIKPWISPWARHGFSPSAIPGSIWELTPWSFLVDYVVDVGSWIESAVAASVPFYYGTKSQRTTVLKTGVSYIYGTPSSKVLGFRPGSFVLKRVSYERFPMYSWPTYMPRIHLLDGLSVTRMANIGALARGRIRSW